MTLHPGELCCCGHTYEVHFGSNCSKQGCSCERFVWIEAGPELLEALERMVAVANWHDTIQSEEEFDAMIAKSEAAIRKAKGDL